MNQDTFEKSSIELLNSMNKEISYLVKSGYRKEQIREYFHKKHETVAHEFETPEFSDILKKVISMLNNIADNLIDSYIFLYENNTLKSGIVKLYQQMENEKRLSYIGKDGKDYYSREELERSNKDYMNQMYTENKPRKM